MQYQFLYLSNVCFLYIYNKFTGISHNVPAVYDVFAVAIRERGVFQQPQKCGWRLAWE
jgi:hypothetical protein